MVVMNLYLFFGFSVIWIVLFCFLLYLFSQQRKLAAAIESIRKQVS